MPYHRSVELTTDASGDATAFTGVPVNGAVLSVRYVPDATDPLDTGADVTITLEDTGHAVLTENNIGTSALSRHPRAQVHDAADGGGIFYAPAGEPVAEPVHAANERIKVVIAQGGNAKSGKFIFTLG